MLIFGPCIFPLMILPNQHVENDIIFNCCIAEWYLNLPNAIDKHLGSLKSFVITKQSLKYIFVYMSEYICSRIVELKVYFSFRYILLCKEVRKVLITSFHSYLLDAALLYSEMFFCEVVLYSYLEYKIWWLIAWEQNEFSCSSAMYFWVKTSLCLSYLFCKTKVYSMNKHS